MKEFKLKASVCAIALTLVSQYALAEDVHTQVNDGEAALFAAKKLESNERRAKNVILFVGDGMGISTITAARIFEGQQKGLDGERNKLAFEKLPYVALSKTYSTNQQTSDSAPTMTAMVTGVKTNDGILSLNQSVARSEPNNSVVQANKVTTILEQAAVQQALFLLHVSPMRLLRRLMHIHLTAIGKRMLTCLPPQLLVVQKILQRK